MSHITLVVLFICAILTAAISGMIGMAGGVTLLSIMTFFMAWEVLIPIHGVAQLVSNGSRTLILRQHISWPIFKFFIIGAPIGAGLSVLFIKSLDSKTVPLLLVAVLIFYVLFKPKKLPKLNIPHWGFAPVGVFTGFLGILVGATGPFQAAFFLRDDLSKEQVVATKAMCQFVVHLTKLPAFFFLGFDYLGHILVIVLLSLASVLGTKLGVFLLGKISEKVFIWLYKTALFLAGLRILYKVFVE